MNVVSFVYFFTENIILPLFFCLLIEFFVVNYVMIFIIKRLIVYCRNMTILTL